MRIGLFLIFLFCVNQTFAQKFPFDYWHEGKVVLESGDTLRGNVKYDLQNDLLQFEMKSQLESFTARKVLFFQIFDRTANRYRSFYSLPYSLTGGYKSATFFELLVEGRMTLLCREAVEYRNTSTFTYYGSYRVLVLVYKYFLLNENGNIEAFNGNKNDLIAMMGNQGDEVAAYMKRNKLKLDNQEKFVATVKYYNSLFK